MASLRSAIDAFCKSCIYDAVGGKGSWRQQVEACTSYRCPLYPVRPKSSACGSEDENSGESAANETVPAGSEAA